MKFLNFITFFVGIIIISSFFLPWISVGTMNNRGLNVILKPDRLIQSQQIRGIQIPEILNKKESKILIKIAGLFFGQIKNLDKKSYYLYIVPLIGILLIFCSFIKKNYKLISLLFIFLGFGTYLLIWYRLKTVNFDNFFINVNIKEGIDLIKYSFLSLGIIGLLRIIFLR